MRAPRAARRITRLTLLAAGLACVASPGAEASATREILASFDRAGKLPMLDAREAARLAARAEETASGVPGDVLRALRAQGLREARLWEIEGAGIVLQVLRDSAGTLWQERLILDAAGTEALRTAADALVAAETAAGEVAGGPDRRGRPMLLTGGGVVGLGLYSWAVPWGADLDGKTAAGVAMLSASAGFVLPYLATSRGEVTPGMTNLSLWGSTRGALHGYLLRRATEDGFAERSEPRATAAALGSLLEGIGGFVAAKHARLSPGDAHLIGVGGDLGLASGFAWNEVFQIHGDDREGARTFLGASLLGLAGAAAATPATHWTWGDAEVFRACGLLGSGVGLSAAAIANDDDRTLAACSLVGLAGGLAFGSRHVGVRDYHPSDAVLVDLGSIAGGAFGVGLTYLLTSDAHGDDESLYLSTATLGAIAGFVLASRLTR